MRRVDVPTPPPAARRLCARFCPPLQLFIAIANGDAPYESPDTFFDILDADGSGSVSIQEVRRMFTALLPTGTDASVIESISKEVMGSGATELTREELRSKASKIRELFLK